MIVCVPVGPDGQVGASWGRAPRVAVAHVTDGTVLDWQEHPVGWDALHDAGTHGSHHARVARFLREQGVEVVLAGHLGDGMVRMLGTMQVRTVLGVQGDARAAAAAAGHVHLPA